jgi:Na+/H+ antiporter NhaD/arsenite permease-like protein
MTTHLASVSSAQIIPLWLCGPFALLLLLIAVMPLTPHKVKHFWERFYPLVSIGLGLLIALHYVFRIDGGGVTLGHTMHEYFSFMALIGSLYVVAGGIHIRVAGELTPGGNVVYLLVGAVLANFIGTTGASMVMIRAFINTNKVRISAYHIVFFIFIVSNCGGALTPIGDPPLFLGYLRGVPFFWLIEHVITTWLITIGSILAIFYVIDRRHYMKMSAEARRGIEEPDTWRFDGGANVLFLGIIIGAVFLPETYFLREIVMLGAAAGSYFTTKKDVHELNKFGFGPIKEVAFLFIGIFATMMPALGYLGQNGSKLNFTEPQEYYLGTGSLSAVLDNAPTYLNFLKLAEVNAMTMDPAAFAGVGDDEKAAVRVVLEKYPWMVVAVSLGAVFFGAMTYIGNGPNFMVKSIAEEAGVKVPTFLGYVFKFSLPILLPILLIVGFLCL